MDIEQGKRRWIKLFKSEYSKRVTIFSVFYLSLFILIALISVFSLINAKYILYFSPGLLWLIFFIHLHFINRRRLMILYADLPKKFKNDYAMFIEGITNHNLFIQTAKLLTSRKEYLETIRKVNNYKEDKKKDH